MKWKPSTWWRECTAISRRFGIYVKYAVVKMSSNLGQRTLFIPVQVSISSRLTSQCSACLCFLPHVVRKVICNLLYGWKKV